MPQGNRRRFVGVAGRAALWLVTALAALVMFNAGLDKFTSAQGWQHWFTEVWGYPVWLRALVGVAESAGALLLLWPRTASYSAGALIVIMLGAFWTVTTKPSDLSAFDPALNTALLTLVLAGWWSRRYRLPGSHRPP